MGHAALVSLILHNKDYSAVRYADLFCICNDFYGVGFYLQNFELLYLRNFNIPSKLWLHWTIY